MADYGGAGLPDVAAETSAVPVQDQAVALEDQLQAAAPTMLPIPSLPPVNPNTLPTLPPANQPQSPTAPGQGGSGSTGKNGCCPPGTLFSWVAPSGTRVCLPSTAECADSGTGGGGGTSSLCKIPYIGQPICDYGSHAIYGFIALLLVLVGLWAILGGATVVKVGTNPVGAAAGFAKKRFGRAA